MAAPYDATARLRALLDELEGLNSKLAQPAVVRTAKITVDNSSGSSDVSQALFNDSTPSRVAVIKRDAGDTGSVYVGGVGSQDYPLDPGEKLEVRIDDLSKVYVKVAAGAKASIYVLWEV